MQLRASLAVRQGKAEARANASYVVAVGDKVFLQRPLLGALQSTSKRLSSRAYSTLYEVKKVVSPHAVILMNPDTGETDLGFGQPVSITRLIPYDLPSLERPVNADEPLKLEILHDGVFRPAQLVAQSATGAVRLRFHDGDELVTNLDQEEYRWIA